MYGSASGVLREKRPETAILPPVFHSDEVGAVVHRLFIAREGTSLRREDIQKTHELAAMLGELVRIRRGATLVDAAAGKASVGLVAAELLPIGSVTVIERDPKRVAACRDATTRLSRAIPVDVREADVGDERAWPHAPDAVVALHACGPASDIVLERAVAAEARFLFLVPCCYGKDVPFIDRALAIADTLGAAQHQNVRRRIATSIVDLERTLRLEAAGYETEAHEFVGATVTPHNLLLRARRTRSPKRMADAAQRLRQIVGEARDGGG
jgi:hypothetical protein